MMTTAPTMPRSKSDKDSQVTLALPGAWLDDAQRIAEVRAESGGFETTRAEVLRVALRRGLDALAAEHGATRPAKKPSAKR
jgi:hypothetical protein